MKQMELCSYAVDKITWAQQTFKIVSDSEFKREYETLTIKKTVEAESQSHELIIHNLQVLSLDLHFSNSFEIRLNF